MTNIMQLIQIISGVLLIILVLIQPGRSDSGGLTGETGSFMRTRRGGEKFIFTLTIIIAIVFVAISALRIILA